MPATPKQRSPELPELSNISARLEGSRLYLELGSRLFVLESNVEDGVITEVRVTPVYFPFFYKVECSVLLPEGRIMPMEWNISALALATRESRIDSLSGDGIPSEERFGLMDMTVLVDPPYEEIDLTEELGSIATQSHVRSRLIFTGSDHERVKAIEASLVMGGVVANGSLDFSKKYLDNSLGTWLILNDGKESDIVMNASWVGVPVQYVKDGDSVKGWTQFAEVTARGNERKIEEFLSRVLLSYPMRLINYKWQADSEVELKVKVVIFYPPNPGFISPDLFKGVTVKFD